MFAERDKKFMDILLLNPYYSQPKQYYSFFKPHMPLGLMYLASYLYKNGIDSEICELGVFKINDAVSVGSRVRFGLSDENIRSLIKEKTPKIVGLTSMYSIYYGDVVEIARTIKKFDPSITVVVGGNHASSYWRHILKNKSIDVVVIGEGEETFLELSRNILSRKEFSNVPGLAFRNSSGEPVRTQARELISNIDDIPFPAYDKVDADRYFEKDNPFVMRIPVAGIISSRGCPGSCVYCTVKAVWGRTWRGRSPENVVDEMRFLYNKYNIREMVFLDDSASVDKKRWLAICERIIKSGLKIKWTTPNGIAHWTLDEEILDKMKESGCYRITLGIESGDPETRKFLGKPYPLEQAKKIINHANKIGMWTICTNIIGFPYEDKSSIEKTIEFAKRSGTDFATFYLLIPQPTSDVYKIFKKEGLLDFDKFFESTEFDEKKFEEINYILNETGCDTVNFKKEELSGMQKKAYRSFIITRAANYLLNPFRLARKIHSFEDFRYVSRLISKGFTIFFRTLNPLFKKSSDYLYENSTPNLETNNE